MLRKEIIFAIIIGLFIGGVILYGIQVANRSARQAQEAKPTPSPVENSTQITPTPDTRPIVITSPINHSVAFSDTLTITGKTSPNSQVALTSEMDDALTSSDSDGNFSTTFKLQGGENNIDVMVFSFDKKTFSTKFSVVYTTAKVDN